MDGMMAAMGLWMLRETIAGRVAVVLLAAAFLLLPLVLAKRLASSSFFRGFLVAVGVFLSFDIVVFHWLFRLHRITAGSQANVIEPILVAAGAGFVIHGLRGSGGHPPRPAPRARADRSGRRPHAHDQR
jgi:hypothetical protein